VVMTGKLFPPLQYQCVEEGLYRSGFPSETNYLFLSSLKLKTLVILGDECPLALIDFLGEEGITAVFIGSSNRIQQAAGYESVGEEMVIKALKLLMRAKHYPVLVTCKTGRALTGCVIACLRKMQGWALISIFEEYRRFAGYKPQQKYEEFIELFDTDVLPGQRNLINGSGSKGNGSGRNGGDGQGGGAEGADISVPPPLFLAPIREG